MLKTARSRSLVPFGAITNSSPSVTRELLVFHDVDLIAVFAASKDEGGCKTLREVDVELFERSAHDRPTCWLRAVARRLIRDAAHREVRTTLEDDFSCRKDVRSARTNDVFALTLRDEQPRLEIHHEGRGDRLTAWTLRFEPIIAVLREPLPLAYTP